MFQKWFKNKLNKNNKLMQLKEDIIMINNQKEIILSLNIKDQLKIIKLKRVIGGKKCLNNQYLLHNILLSVNLPTLP